MRMPIAAAKRIFFSSLDAVLPPAMIHNHLKRREDTLLVDGKSYKLNHNVHVVGFGKAVSGMCRAVQDLLGDHIVTGIISVPVGTTNTLKNSGKSFLLPIDDGKISMFEGAMNNLPDAACHKTTLNLLELMRKLNEDDIVITLVSGGGSALLCAPVPPILLQDKLNITALLAKRGASIQELNTIRKVLSEVKGGGLAQIAYPSKMITLILSDVIGDPLDLIASGPTVRDTSSLQQRLEILEKYNLIDEIPSSAQSVLLEEVPQKTSKSDFSHVQNVMVGTNAIAVEAAVEAAENLGYTTFVLSKQIEGEARNVGVFLIEFGLALRKAMLAEINLNSKFSDKNKFWEACSKNALKKLSHVNLPWLPDVDSLINKIYNIITPSNPRNIKKICMIAAGETTVSVTGTGVGGRNQEMILAAAIHYFKCCEGSSEHKCNLTFLSAGTDGQDGPTDAAGALFESCSNFVKNLEDLGRAEKALRINDSNSFLSSYSENLLKPGLTGTNVMDLQILTLDEK